jgi:glucokinase
MEEKVCGDFLGSSKLRQVTGCVFTETRFHDNSSSEPGTVKIKCLNILFARISLDLVRNVQTFQLVTEMTSIETFGNHSQCLLAADFGGTRIKIGLLEGGSLRASRVYNTTAGHTLASELAELRLIFEELVELAQSPLEAMAWGLPCIVAPDHQTVTRTFGKFEDAPELDLAGWVQRYFGVPLLLDNDARAAVVGEWRYGAGKGCDNLVMVTLGTGIGTAVISQGRPLYGGTGLAGNLGGHSIIHSGGRLCPCGLRGCAEAHVGSWALPALARESVLFADSSLASADIIDYRLVFEHARRGDALAKELKANAIHDWTVVLVNLIHSFDPERIVIGGGIMAGKDEILPLLEDSLRHMLPESRGITLHATTLGDAAALLGCESLWTQSSL